MQDDRCVLKKQRRWLGIALLCVPLMGFAAQPVVVASIKPVHALVAGVMQGVGEPRLLIPGGASPHEYSLRPSDTRALGTAQVVFWIGPDLENVLVKPLANAKTARSVALIDTPAASPMTLGMARKRRSCSSALNLRTLRLGWSWASQQTSSA